MPSHWGHRGLNIVSSSSPTGTQFLQAAGCAHACRYRNSHTDEVTLVTTGDGTTSEGEFWESLNLACLDHLPVLYLVEDNGYAISVPVECQTAGGNISKLASGFPGLLRREVDGTDFVASWHAAREALDYVRTGRGPAMLHAHVIRPYSHSLSDDERNYKTPAEREAEAARDPITEFPKWLIQVGYTDEQGIRNLTHEIDLEIQEATDKALAADPPARGSAYWHLYSGSVDPTSADFDTFPPISAATRGPWWIPSTSR